LRRISVRNPTQSYEKTYHYQFAVFRSRERHADILRIRRTENDANNDDDAGNDRATATGGAADHNDALDRLLDQPAFADRESGSDYDEAGN
jgi:hypothetical protein